MLLALPCPALFIKQKVKLPRFLKFQGGRWYVVEIYIRLCYKTVCVTIIWGA